MAKFGATGKFPQGKVSEDDEGELRFGVSSDGALVNLSFGKPVAWVGMDPPLARKLASMLTAHADKVDGGSN